MRIGMFTWEESLFHKSGGALRPTYLSYPKPWLKEAMRFMYSPGVAISMPMTRSMEFITRE